MSIHDAALDRQADAERIEHDFALRAARDEVARWKSAAQSAEDRASDLEARLSVRDSLEAGRTKPPKWLAPKRSTKTNEATACFLLSDPHFDEVVEPAEVDWRNAYDRGIAELRLRRWADRAIDVTLHHRPSVSYRGAVVMLGGDMLSGNLHDLAEFNEDTVIGSVLHWAPLVAAALGEMADAFGKVHVPCVVGNHGRLTKKPRTKNRARDNLDYLLYHQVERYFANDDRLTFDIPEGTDAWVQVDDVGHLLTHGDQVTGGSGIGGIWPPIMRLRARKAERMAVQDKRLDVLCMGHWHQLINAPEAGLIVNGSNKAWDEYAAIQNFKPEQPQQAGWIVTPEHGVVDTFPILTGDRVAEGW